jgi:hypothetical protein
VCGPLLPGGPFGSGGAGGEGTPDLEVQGKRIVRVYCQSQEPGTCAGTLYAVDAVTGSRGVALSKTKRRRIGKKKNVVKLKLKLTKSGRSAFAASGDMLPAVLELTIVGRQTGTRRTSDPVTLVPPQS